MDQQINQQIEMQNKISNIVKIRQEQITELKYFYDYKNKKLYKEIILIGNNLNLFDKIFMKGDYKLKCENLLSLSVSLGKILDLNNSVKTILIALKIFEEHINYIKNHLKFENSKNYIKKMFEKNNSLLLSQNDFIKDKIKNINIKNNNLLNSYDHLNINYENSSNEFLNYKNFYNSLYKNDGNFFADFNRYLAFQTDSKSKNNSNFNYNDFGDKLKKVINNSNSYNFYNRINLNFEIDYPSLVLNACDIFFMLYNKMMDKICYNPYLYTYIELLDNYIIEYFIQKSSDDLLKLSGYILKNDNDDLISNLDKIYNC